jgi:tRNA 2-thiouridine synthesizing protein B
MATLHTVNKSPFATNTLVSCLNHAINGDSILLIEDGVYGGLKDSSISKAVSEKIAKVAIYILKADFDARGLNDANLIEGIKVTDYKGFVDMAAKHDLNNAWL